MKRVNRCCNCTECAVRTPAGFIPADELYCSLSHIWVDPDDGCTFGHRGEPMRYVEDVDVDIETSAAVYGRCRW